MKILISVIITLILSLIPLYDSKCKQSMSVITPTVTHTVTPIPSPIHTPKPTVKQVSRGGLENRVLCSDEELILLAHLVNAEAPDDDIEGQIAVANVVINRVESEEFPNTIKDVIFQVCGGSYQFTPVLDGTIYKDYPPKSLEAATRAVHGERLLPEDILYFFDPKYTPKKSWIRTRKQYTRIGCHIFCY